MKKVVRGKGQLARMAQLVAALSPDLQWQIEVTRHAANRTLTQNKRYWVAVTELANETGYSKDEMHDAMKRKFLPPVLVELGDEVVAVPASSARLNRKVFAEYMERVIAFAATEFGIAA